MATKISGGVDSVALQILSKVGYKNISALVRKEHQKEVPISLGATDVVFASELEELNKPLNKQKYDFVLDTVGGEVASTLITQVSYDGSMSMCGNAGGLKLTSTVLPFILRGVDLLGIDSVNVPIQKRYKVWDKIAEQWNISQSTLVNEITLNELPETINALKNGQHLGRTIVKY